MKNLCIALAACISSQFIFGQSDRPKEIQLRGGVGISAYNTSTNLSYDVAGFPISNNNTGEAGTVHFPVELRYELTRRVNLGFNSRFGSYLYEPVNAESGEKSNNFWALGGIGEFNIVGRDNFRWYLGLGVHYVRLNQYETVDFGTVPILGEIKLENSTSWAGIGSTVHTGFLWFIAGSPIGINFNAGFDGVNLDLKEFTSVVPVLGPQKVVGQGSLSASGLKLDLGLAFRLKRD